MRTRLAEMLAAAAFLAGCDGMAASTQVAAADANAAAADEVTLYRVPSISDPYPRNGYCSAGACSWFETREQQVVMSSEHERMVRIALATGTSSHPDNRFPANAAVSGIEWTATEQAFVFCSRYRPSVLRRTDGGGWQAVRVDMVRGMGDFGFSQKAIFGLVCHLRDDWAAENFFDRNGYRLSRGEAVMQVAHPQALPLIFPHDPDRPDQGGMAVSNSAPSEPVTMRMPGPPPTSVSDVRPMKDRADHFELFAGSVGEPLRSIAGPFASAAECERARAARPEREWPQIYCLAGDREVR